MMDKPKSPQNPHSMNLISKVLRNVRTYMLSAEYEVEELIIAVDEAYQTLGVSDISEDIVNELKKNILDINNPSIKSAWLQSFPRVYQRVADTQLNEIYGTSETKLTPDSIWNDSSTNARNLKRVFLALLNNHASDLAWRARRKYKDKAEFLGALDRLSSQGLFLD